MYCNVKTHLSFWAATITVMVLCATALSPSTARADHALVMAVHPYLSADEILTRFQPLADRLSAALGHDVKISVSPDYDTHITRMTLGEVDFAYMGPAAYVSLSRSHVASQLLARLSIKGAPKFHGYIVTRDDSSLQTLAALKGRKFAFGDERSTMSYMAPYAMLLDAGVGKPDLGEHAFLGSHKNVALAVLAGAFDAGGVKEEVYFAYKDKGLRALAMSPPVSEHLFVGTPRLSVRDGEKLRAAMFDMATTDEGLAALRAIKSTMDALVPVTDADYAPLRQMMNIVENGP